MTFRRREFLQRVAAGSAALTMPASLAGCGVHRAQSPTTQAVANPFME